MRASTIVFALLLSLAGCGGSGGDGSLGNDNNGTGGNGMPGAQGAACTTACDCQPGLGCNAGKCGNGTAPAYYCCDTPATCPQSSVCQTRSGQAGYCGGVPPGGGSGGTGGGTGGTGGGTPDAGSGGGGIGVPIPGLDGGIPSLPDGGISGLCALVPCSSDATCTAIGCGSCNSTAGTCQ